MKEYSGPKTVFIEELPPSINSDITQYTTSEKQYLIEFYLL